MFGGRPSDPRYRVVRLSGEEHRILIAGSGIPVVIPFQDLPNKVADKKSYTSKVLESSEYNETIQYFSLI